MIRDRKPWGVLACFGAVMLVIAWLPSVVAPWVADWTAGLTPTGWLGTLLLERVGPAWLTLIAAALVVLGAIPVHCAGTRRRRADPKRRQCWWWAVSTGMNAISGGLAVSAFYLHTQRMPELTALLTGLLPGMMLLLLAALLLSLFPAAKKPVLILLAVADAVLIVAQFLHPAGTWAAVFGLLSALCGLLALALNAGREGRFLLRDVSRGSFGAAMLIGLVVLVVITEGDALDGLDAGFDLPDGGQPAKKNRAEGVITR